MSSSTNELDQMRALTIRRAESEDLETVRILQAEAVAWLASKGLDQWQPGSPRARHSSGIEGSIAAGTCYLAHNDEGAVVGTLTLDRHADQEFWTSAEREEPAFYIHRMIVARSAAGRDLGRALLEWAEEQARQAGVEWLRLDAWRTNRELHRYYERHGFEHVRTVNLAHRGSGALFQRRVPFQG